MWQRLRNSRFVRDSALLQVSQGAIAVSQLLSTVAVAYILGEFLQGEFFTALAIYGFGFMLLATGVVQATVSQVSVAISKQQAEKAASWLAFLVKSYFLVGLVTVVGGYWLFPWLAVFIMDDPVIGPEVGRFAWWLAFTPFLELPRVVAVATFQGARRMGDLAVLEMGSELARLALVTGGAWLTGSAAGPVLGTLGASLCSSVLGVYMYRRMSHGVGHKLPGPSQILARVRDVPLSAGLRLGFRIGALRSVDALTLNILPTLVIQYGAKLTGQGDGSAWVTYFRIAQRFLQVPIMALGAFSRTALPALGGIAGRRDADAFRRAFLRVTLTAGSLMALAVVATYLVLPLVASLIYKGSRASYVEPIVHLGGILALAYGISGFSVAFDSFYIYTQRLRAAVVITVLGFFVSVPSMFVLSYHFPRTGVAWGVVVCYGWVLVHLVYIAFFFRGKKHLASIGGPPPNAAAAAPAAVAKEGA